MKRVRLQDIADRLGVSLNTASRALRDCSDISLATKERVRAKAKEMGYIPSNLSSYLSLGKSQIITVIVYNLANCYFSLMADAVIRELSKHGYQCLLRMCEKEEAEYEDIVFALANQCVGIISLINIDKQANELCEKKEIPVTLIGRTSYYNSISSFDSNDFQGGVLIAKECIAKGLKRPCYLSPKVKGVIKKRVNGFKNELEKANINLDIYECAYEDDIYEFFANAIIENENDFVFAYNDEIAINIKRLLKKHRYKKIDIFGFDGIGDRLPIISPINGLSIDWSQVIKDACENMLERIEKNDFANTVHNIYPMHIIKKT
ncbi:MAG: LacI family DNA-binding transcriptional regulator [Bacilli bacterium]